MEGSAGLLCGTHVLCHCTGSIISLSILDALVQSSQQLSCLPSAGDNPLPWPSFFSLQEEVKTTPGERVLLAAGPVGSASGLLLHPSLERATAKSNKELQLGFRALA